MKGMHLVTELLLSVTYGVGVMLQNQNPMVVSDYKVYFTYVKSIKHNYCYLLSKSF